MPAPPPPAECTGAGITLFAPELSTLPDDWAAMDSDSQVRELLILKQDDTQQYQLLRAQALRCAH
ncbi:hypothetical protein [Dyella japonica]|uniref:Uncharacterized protein n=1 Tax=Dyella japonica DSM 16301 TaxID=1440762 RepID=A0A0G9H6H0_9GAMM|nr:hypothetical protein [Dyella japonica]KLD65435.1 hypothetical protein Y882_02645 [Dyella japonica DSM 16301]